MKIAILGAGALGSAIGGVLTEAGNAVWLITHNWAHVEAINQQGLVLRSNGIDRVVKAQAATDCIAVAKQAGVMDCVVVLVKSAQTQNAVAAALPLIGPHTAVLSLQNGLGHEDVISSIVGKQRVLAGKTYCGGQIIAPGHVICAVQGKDTHIGELGWNGGGAVSPRLQQLANVFNAAGLQTFVTGNIVGTMWDKLFINVATGALSAITGLVYGDLYKQMLLQETGCAAVAEAMAVARALGVRISTTDPLQAWTKAGAGLPYAFKTSMLQTLERGARTEVDYVNGAVVREGARLGVPTPVNQTLWACMQGLEYSLVQPTQAFKLST